MTTCIKCNTSNNAGNLHCENCEAILPVEGENRCPFCAEVNGPFAENCKQCGYVLKKIEDVQPRTVLSNAPPQQANVTKLSTYKKKRQVNHFKRDVKQRFTGKSFGSKLVLVVLAALFVIGVVSSFT